MRVIHCQDDLEKLRPPPTVLTVARHELSTLLEISGGNRIDPANGRVVLFEAGDTDSQVNAEFGCPFSRLPFEGVVRRGGCWVGYVAHDNQCLSALVIPDAGITPAWLGKLQSELCPGGE